MPECTICGSETNFASELCPTCGSFLGAPNVRTAGTPEMREALEVRFLEASQRASQRGAGPQAEELRKAGARTAAIVSMSLNHVRSFIENENSLYSTYQLQVRSSARQATDPENDRMRQAVDGSVHGSYGERITYASLSLDGRGVASYGNISLKLRDVTVASRATVLEENSWIFVRSRDLFGKSVPPGYVSIWSDREKLVVAKLADLLTSETSESEMAALILTQAKSRQDERFLEVHIFGTFNAASIESVMGSSQTSKPLERAELAWIKEKLAALGKAWVEA